ncbi:hypothetical protein GO986_08920 [Deinococcus sp. HMF7620]|uniref:Uncharacterized protein n=1 Tax=Deinococcus arboris TaxID=2682977 RepID=A0A7C9M640_9DEIO|nr:hypothetical protein [Deinococcus arboris]MVN86885.1 hypothetical protein [Deinococcus arboris]
MTAADVPTAPATALPAGCFAMPVGAQIIVGECWHVLEAAEDGRAVFRYLRPTDEALAMREAVGLAGRTSKRGPIKPAAGGEVL